jgi:quercetin dioxygenase-like cupin family protein
MNQNHPNHIPWTNLPIEGFEEKVLLSLQNGFFKMVKLEAGAVFPHHQHPDRTEFAYVVEGVLEATIGSEIYVGEKGMFFQFPVTVPHGLKNPSEEVTLLLIGGIKDEAQ